MCLTKLDYLTNIISNVLLGEKENELFVFYKGKTLKMNNLEI
jgi:hypothetical protein